MRVKSGQVRPVYEELYDSIFWAELYNIHGSILTLEDVMPEDAAPTVKYVIDHHPNLTDREREIMTSRYVNERGLKDIGGDYCVTRERVRQIISKATRKMNNSRFGLYRAILRYGLSLYNQAVEEYKTYTAYAKAEMMEQIKNTDAELIALKAELLRKQTAVKQTVDATALEMPIEDCDFSVRTYNCLGRAGVRTVGQVAVMTEDHLKRIRNLGSKSLTEIKCWFSRHGIDAACLNNMEEHK